jgi:beta-lactamase regulating signal transducer with metallopeptidase domain
VNAGLLNHLWQSTLFAFAAAALAGLLSGNRASVRHGIWVIASVKWLVPFAWLIGAGGALTVMSPIAVGGSAPTVATALSSAVRQMAEPFPTMDPSTTLSTSATSLIALMFAVLWAGGALAVAATRLRGWLRIRSAVRQSVRTNNALSDPHVDVHATSDLLEPGVVGVWRPVLLLPAGIEHQLTRAQLQSVLAHEQCHVRRRDNLTGFVHIVVETVFWFHPLVWWIGARLVDERERACDEAVLILGIQPRDYAEGIVNVCKHYVESPIACVAGVTGSNLKRRIEDIMMKRIGSTLTVGKRLVLTTAAALAVATPIVAGAVTAPVRPEAALAVTEGQSTTVGDMAAVVRVMNNAGATAEERERLVGKVYSGVVVVDAVRLPQQDSTVAIVMALPSGEGDGTAARIGFRFNGRRDDPTLQDLRKGKSVRVRGTLTGFSTDRTIQWADFKDLVIEGASSR